MATIQITASITYDENIMHGDDPEAIEWFHDVIKGAYGDLLVHSNEIGDTLGTLSAVEIINI